MTPLQIAEILTYTAGVERARAEYEAHPFSDEVPGRCRCTDEMTCIGCRRTAEADLLVATSPSECHELLALLDKPAPKAGRLAVAPCGTEAARRRHLKHGETCEVCRAGIADDPNCGYCGAPLIRPKRRGGRPKRFCGQVCAKRARRKAAGS